MRLVVLALLLGLALPAWSEQVFVRNVPFRGRVLGTGPQLLVELAPLLEQLGLPATDPDVTIVERNGFRLVNLQEFARWAGARVVANPQLESLDVTLPRPRVDWVLLHFTASWCGPCRQLQPLLARAAAELQLSVHTVDLDQDTPDRERYVPFFEGRRLPFLVLLDPSGRPVGRWSGSPTYPQLLTELRSARGRP